jgi:hypothetical protein
VIPVERKINPRFSSYTAYFAVVEPELSANSELPSAPIPVVEPKITSKGQPTPLWIISLFVALVEGVASIALVQTQGQVQLVLTIFVVTFPLLVALGFFIILWYKNYVFYSPSEYGQQIAPKDFVAAMIQQKATDIAQPVKADDVKNGESVSVGSKVYALYIQELRSAWQPTPGSLSMWRTVYFSLGSFDPFILNKIEKTVYYFPDNFPQPIRELSGGKQNTFVNASFNFTVVVEVYFSDCKEPLRLNRYVDLYFI